MAASRKNLYSKPIISKPASGEWCVFFRYYNEQTRKMQPIKCAEGLNRFHDPVEKQKEAVALLEARIAWLEMGWNPIIDREFLKRLDLQPAYDIPALMSFERALDFALDNCIVAKKTKSCYKTTVKYVKLTAQVLVLTNLTIDKIKKRHIKLILNKCRERYKWSNNNFNKNLSHLSAILSRLEDFEMIEYNPAHKIKTLPVVETLKFKPYTETEKKAIWSYFFINHYKFLVYFLVIYFTGIRPKELLSLKIKDIDLDNRRITIYPDLEEENSKTKKIRHVPISDELYPFLRELKLEEYPSHYYVFGNVYASVETGKISQNGYKVTSGWKQYPERDPNFFAPSPFVIRRDTATKFWKKVIVDKLKIKKYQYAAKHTGANAMILAGIDLDTLKELYGHSSKLMTEKYVTTIKEIHAKTIISKQPAFLTGYSEKSPS